MGAHVEHHVLGRAVDPGPDDALGQRLARRVDLHDPGVLRALDHVAGCDDGADLDARVHLGARATAGPRCALSARSATPAAVAAAAVARAAPTAARAATTTAASAAAIRTGSARRLPGRFGRAHRRQANGCRSISPRSFRSTGGRITWHCASSGPGSAVPAPPRCSSRCSSCSTVAATTWPRPSVGPTTSRCGTPRSTVRRPTGTRSWPNTSPPSTGRRAQFWSELAEANPDASRAPLDPLERRRVVEERRRHDLHRSRRETSRRTHHRCSVRRSRW